MAQAPRDANHVPAGLGVSNTDGTTTLPFYIDSATGRVLLDLSVVADAGGSVSDEPDERDANRVTAMLCLKEDGSGLGSPAIDNRNGYLYLDLS